VVERIKEKELLVLYILTKLELGGAQKVCLTLFKGVAKRGHLSGLITGAEGVLVPKVQEHENVHLLHEFRREVGFKNLPAECKAFFSMYRLIKKMRREYPAIIVHTHSTKAGVLGRWAAFLAGVCKRVHTVHGFGFNDFQSWPRWLFYFMLEYVTSFVTTHYVCVSEKDRLLGIKKLPFFVKKSSLIRAAVDWDRFYIPAKKEKKPAQCFVIGTVSCLKPQKNVIDLLQAFKFVYEQVPLDDRQRIFLHIIGDGELRDELEAFVREYGLMEQVAFLGWQSDVSKWMKGWNIFAMSSLWEGLPCAVVEARLCKLPVVAYDVGGITEIVVPGKNGFMVNAGDWQALADKLLLLFRDDHLCMDMVNYEENLTDFKNSSMVREHVTLYKKLMRVR
jgi:glycosyltransferase involved in cell wall biosynthesis